MAARTTDVRSAEEADLEDKAVEAKEKTKENETIAKVDTERKLIVDLNKVNERLVEEGADNLSPIPQMDGEAEKDEPKDPIFTFVSDYAEEDIVYTLQELFPAKDFSLLSRVRLRPMCADHECTVALTARTCQSFIWPDMIGIQAQVCKEVRRTK